MSISAYPTRRSIRSRSRSCATSSKASPTRCSRRCCARPSRRSSRKASMPRRACSPSRARRWRRRAPFPSISRTLIPVVATMLERFPLDDDDSRATPTCMNDPYLGGTHLPDIARGHADLLAATGRSRCRATMTHHQDMGGMSPGSVPTNATEIFQEGLRIPPLKLRDAGRINETLVAMIRQNVRIPDTVMGDLNAQIAACNVGARRIAELAGTLGRQPCCWRSSTSLLDRSESMTREALRTIPEGTYRYVDFSDNDGIELDKPHPLRGRGHREGRQLSTCDFTGSCAAGARAVQLRAVRARSPRPALRSAPSPIRRSRPTPAASGPITLRSAARVASSIRPSPRRSTRARRPSSAWPAAFWARCGR